MIQAMQALDVEKAPDPDRVLWLAVINQAIDDYESYVNGRKADPYKAAAHRGAFHWIERAGDWFRMVCFMADLDPESVQAAARQRAVPGIRLIRTR
jgi:hypothetical protein